ncbi:MAG TPA: hypothetical protein ENK98_05090 [Epsilonproteobacteria bacterium]|nr:hypothetical protein [Campylobacterota bacterium]
MVTFIGGCSGSTSCGIKIFRFQVVYELLRNRARVLLYPNGIFIPHYNGHRIEDGAAHSVMGFLMLFFTSFLVLSLILSMLGLDTITALSATATKIPDLINTMTTIRDKMIVILLAFGGIRISELLHLYVFDIKRDNNGTAKVTIYNPVEGQHIWIDQNKKKHKDTRRNFLEQMYGRLPRNMLLPEDGLYIGWKGVAEEDSRKHISYVEWTVHEMGKAFYKLHKEYIKIRASYNADHPYYFVAESGATKGQPLRQSSLTAHLYNKFRKIGLDTLDDGVNPHGLRHYYGYYAANVLELDSDILQVMMRHKSKTSTDIYYHLTEETIRKKLEEGYKKISNNKELLSCLL